MTEHKDDYPRMVYHVVESPVIVYSDEELQFHLDRGWSRTPKDFSELEALKAKIAYHQAEAERLADKLIELEDLLKNKNKLVESVAAEPEKPHRGKKK